MLVALQGVVYAIGGGESYDMHRKSQERTSELQPSFDLRALHLLYVRMVCCPSWSGQWCN